MQPISLLCLLLAACLCLPLGAAAAQVESEDIYCFTAQDFSEEEISGICVTGLPDPATGTVMLGHRVVRCGDILTADQVAQMTFSPLKTQEDTQGILTYLPIYPDRVAPAATLTISIRGKADKAPVAVDSTLETYKNLSNSAALPVSDPEGQPLQYTLLRKPRRGEVELQPDGTFIYTPRKNKVGIDSFTFTATDPAGNVSREATVTVQILKPSDAVQYADTMGTDCGFEALWLRSVGLFAGETVGGQACFFPEKTVSRGEFVTMLVKLLELEPVDTQAVYPDVPDWLRPYVAAALRSGLLEGLPQTQTGSFEAQLPITGAEAAVMLQNALQLTPEKGAELSGEVPVWAEDALLVMAGNGIDLEAQAPLTRGAAAKLLYQLRYFAATRPAG